MSYGGTSAIIGVRSHFRSRALWQSQDLIPCSAACWVTPGKLLRLSQSLSFSICKVTALPVLPSPKGQDGAGGGRVMESSTFKESLETQTKVIIYPPPAAFFLNSRVC